jgi:hypothetical protein
MKWWANVDIIPGSYQDRIMALERETKLLRARVEWLVGIVRKHMPRPYGARWEFMPPCEGSGEHAE